MGLTHGPEEKNGLEGFFNDLFCDVIKENPEQKACQNKVTIKQGRASSRKGNPHAFYGTPPNPEYCYPPDAPQVF
jgi:hypothetical protein